MIDFETKDLLGKDGFVVECAVWFVRNVMCRSIPTKDYALDRHVGSK